MRYERHFATLLGFSIGLATLAGCSVNQPAGLSSPASTLPAMAIDRGQPDAVKHFVYTCQNAINYVCNVFGPHGALLRTITDSLNDPMGAVADPDGHLFIANQNARTILEFGRGGTTLLTTYHDSPNAPEDVAVRGNLLAVANLRNVSVFEKGRKKPVRTLTIPNNLQASAVAFDSKGNCYVAFVKDDLTGSAVDRYANCKGTAHEIDPASGTPYGIAFDGNDNLYFTDLGPDTQGVYKCVGTNGCALAYGQFFGPIYLNFNLGFRDLFVSALGTSSGGFEVAEIDVATGQIVQTFTAGFNPSNPPIGVAPAPGARY